MGTSEKRWTAIRANDSHVAQFGKILLCSTGWLMFLFRNTQREREREREIKKTAENCFYRVIGSMSWQIYSLSRHPRSSFCKFLCAFWSIQTWNTKRTVTTKSQWYGFEFIYKIVWFYSKALNKVLSWEKSSLKSRMSYIKLFDFSNNSRGIRFASFNYLFMRYKKLFDFSPKPFFLITFSYIGKLPCASFDDHFTPTKCFI